jgi:hypothetical protein
MNSQYKQHGKKNMFSNRVLIHMDLHLFFVAPVLYDQDPVVIDHNSVRDFSSIPLFWIQEAKHSLPIAYSHTSHGSQLITGMDFLDQFMGQKGVFIESVGFRCLNR